MLSAIVAIGNNSVIGKGNKLIWHIPEDLKRFKEITLGHNLIMGRKTFQSLPGILPKRKHIVITRDKDFKVEDPRVLVVHSLDSLKEYVYSKEENFVVGGGEIYKFLLPYTEKLYITRVHEDFHGDTFFPDYAETDWKIVFQEKGLKDEKNPYNYEYLIYERRD